MPVRPHCQSQSPKVRLDCYSKFSIPTEASAAEKKQRKPSNERQPTESPKSKSDWKSQKNFRYTSSETKNPTFIQTRIRLLSAELSDDGSDSDLEIIDDGSPTRLKRKRAEQRRRQRSRSRSLTPPPDVPAHQLQNARDVIKCVVFLLLFSSCTQYYRFQESPGGRSTPLSLSHFQFRRQFNRHHSSGS